MMIPKIPPTPESKIADKDSAESPHSKGTSPPIVEPINNPK